MRRIMFARSQMKQNAIDDGDVKDYVQQAL